MRHTGYRILAGRNELWGPPGEFRLSTNTVLKNHL